MKKNDGFSLIELIIVVAIMAVLMTMVALSIGYINSTNTKAMTNELISALDDAKLISMMKESGAGDITFFYEDGKVYYQIGSNEKKVLTSTKIDLEYRVEGAADYTKIDASHSLILQFNKSSGAVKNATQDYYFRIGTRVIRLYVETGTCEFM